MITETQQIEICGVLLLKASVVEAAGYERELNGVGTAQYVVAGSCGHAPRTRPKKQRHIWRECACRESPLAALSLRKGDGEGGWQVNIPALLKSPTG